MVPSGANCINISFFNGSLSLMYCTVDKAPCKAALGFPQQTQSVIGGFASRV
ncbi:unnamed protein product [Brassica rapa]|uniref:Uncharacterized protein n=2 Tax=Brassica TaxID=3705 RepID=A0A8D9D429_BRACM|nr:unnamed protein product [Brassica napus]CAG7868776.1 unnamed protein product [Brassica rapa]